MVYFIIHKLCISNISSIAVILISFNVVLLTAASAFCKIKNILKNRSVKLISNIPGLYYGFGELTKSGLGFNMIKETQSMLIYTRLYFQQLYYIQMEIILKVCYIKIQDKIGLYIIHFFLKLLLLIKKVPTTLYNIHNY